MKQQPDLKRTRQGKRDDVAGYPGDSEYVATTLPRIDFSIAAIRQEIQLIQADMDLLLEAWQKHAGDPSPESVLRLSTAARYISHLAQQRLEKEKLLANFENMRLQFIHQILTVGGPPAEAGHENEAGEAAKDGKADAAPATGAPGMRATQTSRRAWEHAGSTPDDSAQFQANTATH